MNENVGISIHISLKFATEIPYDNNSALVQVIAWCRTGNRPLTEPMMADFVNAYMRHLASMS